MQIQTNNPQHEQILQGCLVFLKAFDASLHAKSVSALRKLGTTPETHIVISDSYVYLPESLFANAVTEHIIYQLLLALREQELVTQQEIDQFVHTTRVAPYIWDIAIQS